MIMEPDGIVPLQKEAFATLEPGGLTLLKPRKRGVNPPHLRRFRAAKGAFWSTRAAALLWWRDA